jgi:beta-aspartyl-peptidase (threonine type)
MNQKKIALAVHGGAGTILKSEMTAELENEYRDGLKNALVLGWNILKNGGSSVDAVETAVVELENFPLFNAGRGAVFTHDGRNEMDACLMEGKTQQAGAVASVKNVKNPIKLARLVLEKTEHILLAGNGANAFAAEMNVEMETDDYFFTDFRYQAVVKSARRRRHPGLTTQSRSRSWCANPKSKQPILKIQSLPVQRPKRQNQSARSARSPATKAEMWLPRLPPAE